MLIGVCVLLAFVTVRLSGGRLDRLAALRLRGMPVVVAAFAVQIIIVNVAPGGDHDLHAALHIATYGVLVAVLAANLRLPGLALLALGGLSNAVAIAVNGGVMPAARRALATAGMTPDPRGFSNSALVAHPHLAFLGDVAGVPSWVPAANVFSVGDVLMVAGCWVLVHRTCGGDLQRGRSSSSPPAVPMRRSRRAT